MREDVGLVVQPPLIGIHQPVVELIHRLIHPHRIGNMNADRHAELAAFLQQRVDAGIIEMQPPGGGGRVKETFALVAHFSDAFGAGLEAPFQLGHCGRSEARLVVTCEVKTAPDGESARVFLIARDDAVKSSAVGLAENS